MWGEAAVEKGMRREGGFASSWKGDPGSYYIRLEDEACSWMERKSYGRR